MQKKKDERARVDYFSSVLAAQLDVISAKKTLVKRRVSRHIMSTFELVSEAECRVCSTHYISNSFSCAADADWRSRLAPL
jgi:hypothetical protein